MENFEQGVTVRPYRSVLLDDGVLVSDGGNFSASMIVTHPSLEESALRRRAQLDYTDANLFFSVKSTSDSRITTIDGDPLYSVRAGREVYNELPFKDDEKQMGVFRMNLRETAGLAAIARNQFNGRFGLDTSNPLRSLDDLEEAERNEVETEYAGIVSKIARLASDLTDSLYAQIKESVDSARGREVTSLYGMAKKLAAGGASLVLGTADMLLYMGKTYIVPNEFLNLTKHKVNLEYWDENSISLRARAPEIGVDLDIKVLADGSAYDLDGNNIGDIITT